MIDVVIGHGLNDGPIRVRAREYVAGLYEAQGFRVHLAQCPTEEWSKGAAVNPVADQTTSEILILADADSFVAPEHLDRAIGQARVRGWAMPHSTVKRLDRESSDRLIRGMPGRQRLERSAYPALPGGGIVIVTRETWDLVGGFDPRFRGWGGEDHAFGLALRCLTGNEVNPRRICPLVHLWHPEAPNCRRPSDNNRVLDKRYRDARSKPDLMAQLVEEARVWASQQASYAH